MQLTKGGSRDTLRLAVAGGRVGCPREGDTDVEHCLACGYLDDMDDPERPQEITCRWRGPDTAVVVDVFDKRWWDRP
jgi:hypothetical protein